jgi:hypothetical protein
VIPDLSVAEQLAVLRIGANGGMDEQPFVNFIFNMTNLKELKLEGCSLTGFLPDEFGQFDELTRCVL